MSFFELFSLTINKQHEKSENEPNPTHEPLVIRIHIPPLSNPSILILCLPNLIADVIECVLCSYTNNHTEQQEWGGGVNEGGR